MVSCSNLDETEAGPQMKENKHLRCNSRKLSSFIRGKKYQVRNLARKYLFWDAVKMHKKLTRAFFDSKS